MQSDSANAHNRCWGLTRTMRRCGRIGPWRFFCKDHQFQPILALAFVIVPMLANIASIYSALLPVAPRYAPSGATEANRKPSNASSTPPPRPLGSSAPSPTPPRQSMTPQLPSIRKSSPIPSMSPNHSKPDPPEYSARGNVETIEIRPAVDTATDEITLYARASLFNIGSRDIVIESAGGYLDELVMPTFNRPLPPGAVITPGYARHFIWQNERHEPWVLKANSAAPLLIEAPFGWASTLKEKPLESFLVGVLVSISTPTGSEQLCFIPGGPLFSLGTSPGGWRTTNDHKGINQPLRDLQGKIETGICDIR